MEFANLSDAIAAAHDNDVIAVRAGTYVDACTDAHKNILFAKNVTIEGVGGMVHLVMGSQGVINGKALIVAENGLTLKNFELSGATDGSPYGNIAGIRAEGGDLTVIDCYIHNNQGGIMGGVPGANFLISHSEIADNGTGSGYTHNIYTGDIASLTVANCYIHGADVGHEVKSRAAVTTIRNNVIANGPTGTASYCIDIPNAGVAVITGNVIEKGPLASNAGIVHYGGETQFSFTTNSLTITGNTIINDMGPTSAWAVWNQSSVNGLNVVTRLSGNQIYGLAPGNLGTGPLNAFNNTTLTTEPIYSTASPWASAPVVNVPTGPLVLDLTAPGNVVTGGTNLLTISDTFGGNTISSGVGVGITLTEAGGSSVVTTLAGTGNTIVLNSARNTLNSAGRDNITITGLYNAVTASGAATITSSSFGSFTLNGAETLFTSAPSNVQIGAPGNVRVVDSAPYLSIATLAGARLALVDSAATVQASATVIGGAIAAFAGTAGITLTAADDGADTVTFGSGATTFTGAAGADTYVFLAGQGGGTDVIDGYRDGIDQLSFQGFSGQPVASGQYVAGNTILTLADGTQVQVNGVALGEYLTPGGQPTAGAVTLTTAGNVVNGGAAPLSVTDLAGNNTINGGIGGLTAAIHGTGSTVGTVAGAQNTLSVSFETVVNSAGTDSIVVNGRGNVVNASGFATVALGFYGNQVSGGAALLRVDDSTGGNAIAGGSGGLAATISGTGSTITTAAGATDTLSISGGTTVASAGSDCIAVSGNYNAITLNGDSTLQVAADSFNSIALNGHDTLNDYGAGLISVGISAIASVNVMQGFVSIMKAAGGVVSLSQQTASGIASATVAGGAAKLCGVDGAHGGVSVITSATDGDDISLGGGSVQVTSLGQDTIHGGSADAVITASGVSTTAMTFIGGSGTAALSAGAGALAATGGSGAMTVAFGSGNATVQVGSGAADIFQFVAGHGGGTDVISGFRPGLDSVQFSGVSVEQQAVSGGSLQLLLTDGSYATFVGVSHL